jgi:hypothetical protein
VVVTVLLLVVARPLLERAGPWGVGSRGAIVASLTLATASPGLVLTALYRLIQPLVANEPGWRASVGDAELVQIVPIWIAFMTAPTALFSLFVAAASSPSGLERRSRWIGRAAFAGGAVLLCLSIVRSARFPDPDHYLTTLPVVARFSARSGEPVETLPELGPNPLLWEVQVYDDPVADLILRRQCSRDGCDVLLFRPSPDDPRTVSDRVRSDEHVPGETMITVRRDAAHALWVVDYTFPGGFYTDGPPAPTRSWLDDGRNIRPKNIDVARVSDRLAPPRGWIVSAAAAYGVAAALLGLRRRRARVLQQLVAGREGVLEASGLVRFPDGEPPVRIAPGQSVAEGPVVVLAGPLAQGGGAYRADGIPAGARVLCGPREPRLTVEREGLAKLDALALALCALAGAPLLAAAIVGLVP